MAPQLGTLTTHQRIFDAAAQGPAEPGTARGTGPAVTHPPPQAVAQAATWAPTTPVRVACSWQAPTQEFKPLDEDDKTLDMRFMVTGGTAGRSGVAGTLGEALVGVLDENNELKLMPMSDPWFETYDFPRYYMYEGDSVVEGEKGTGGADATGSYRGKAVQAPCSPAPTASSPSPL